MTRNLCPYLTVAACIALGYALILTSAVQWLHASGYTVFGR